MIHRDEHCELLFKHKSGCVNVEVWGPRLGWKWRNISLFRWQSSTKEPGQWEKRFTFRHNDVDHVLRCAKALHAWNREDTNS